MKGHFLDDKNNFTSNRMGRLDKFDAVKKDLLDNVQEYITNTAKMEAETEFIALSAIKLAQKWNQTFIMNNKAGPMDWNITKNIPYELIQALPEKV